MKILNFTLSAIALLSFLGCDSHKTSSDNLVVAISSEVPSFKPSHATDLDSTNVHVLLYASLVQIGPNRDIVNDLASNIEISNLQTYQIQIKDAYFHNNEKIKLEDVLFSIQKVKEEAYSSPYKSAFDKISKMSITDGKLVLELDKPDQGFLTDLSVIKIAPASSFDSDKIIGSGPYEFVSAIDGNIQLKAFDKFYDGVAKTKNLNIKIIKDSNTALLKMKAKEVDLLIEGISPNRFSEIESSHEFNTHSIAGLTYSYLALNQKKLASTKIRKAIGHAINRNLLVEKKLFNTASVAHAMFPSNSPYGTNLELKYDVNEAKRLLAEEGFSESKPLSVEFKVSSKKESVEIAQAILEDLSQVGIKGELKTMEWGAFYNDIKMGNFELMQSRWVGITIPKMLYEIYHTENFPPKLNRTFTSIPELDLLLNQLNQATKNDDIVRLSKEIQTLVAEQMPYVPLWHSNILSISQKNIQNLNLWPNASFRCLLPVIKI